jgi:hypothetical protein
MRIGYPGSNSIYAAGVTGPERPSSPKGVSPDLVIQERQVLSREQAIKASAAGASTRTTYTYATGPDGRRYIVGAEVSVVGSEEVLDAVQGGRRTGRSAGVKISNRGEKDGQDLKSGADDPATEQQIKELEKIQNDVIAHEAAHKAAAGSFGGPVSYTYTTGPDGKKYITGGEVPISTPSTNDPEEALRNSSQVMRAALAPGDPSGQDIAVAASAAQMAASARAQIAAGKGEDDNRASGHAKKALEAYSSQISPKGLWTVGGYPQDAGDPADTRQNFKIAV